MSRCRFLSAVLIVVVFVSVDVRAQWVRTGGPIKSVVVPRQVAAVGIARSDLWIWSAKDTLYRSTDLGASWQSVYTRWHSTMRAIGSIDTDIFLLSWVDGVFRSGQNGANWQTASNGLPGGDMRTLTAVGNDLYLGMSTGRVYHSSDHAHSWSNPSTGIPNTAVTSIVASGNRLLASTELGGLYVSTDSGLTWRSSSTGFTPIGANYLFTIGTRTFAAASDSGVFVSTDAGSTWSRSSAGLGANTVVQMNSIGSVLFAATRHGGVYVSTSNGASWTATNSGLPTYDLQSIQTLGTSVIALSSARDLYSADGSTMTWSRLSADLSYTTYVNAYCVLPVGSAIFAGCADDGIYVTHDRGATWTKSDNGMTNPYIVAMAELSGTLFAGSMISTDGGQNWIVPRWSVPYSDTGMNQDTVNYQIVFVDAFASLNGNMFAAASSTDGRGGIYRSTDVGRSWKQVLMGEIATAIIARGTDLFAASSPGFDGAVVRSVDGGINWFSATTGLPGSRISALASIGSTLFASSPGHGIYYSTNDGASWLSSSSSSNPTNTYALYASGTALFAGTSSGVYLSEDLANTWTAVSTGLIDSVYALAQQGSDLYAGATGVWRRPINEMTAHAGVLEPSISEGFAVYPNPVAAWTSITVPNDVTSVRVYNAIGNEVANFISPGLNGQHAIEWNTTALTPGTYTVVIRTRDAVTTRNVVKLGQ